jgi:starch synthase (maltosyl-transferring)
LQQTNDLSFVRIDAAQNQEHTQLMGYVKRSPDNGNIILTVVNLDPHAMQNGWLRFPLEMFRKPHDLRFAVEDLLSGNRYEWNGEWNYVEVNPHVMPAHIFRVILS